MPGESLCIQVMEVEVRTRWNGSDSNPTFIAVFKAIIGGQIVHEVEEGVDLISSLHGVLTKSLIRFCPEIEELKIINCETLTINTCSLIRVVITFDFLGKEFTLTGSDVNTAKAGFSVIMKGIQETVRREAEAEIFIKV